MPVIVGTVDVGSNTLKLTVARVHVEDGIAELMSDADTVRLGSGLTTSGRLADDRIEAAIATLGRWADVARRLGASHLIGVATEATRKAANGDQFLARVFEETGWQIRLIDGIEEAELTFRGVAWQRDLGGHVVIADVGGGSTEVIAASDHQVTAVTSLTIGSGSLTDALIRADPPTREELDACRDSVVAGLETAGLARGSGTRLIAVGGTAEFMAALTGHDQEAPIKAIDRALATCVGVDSVELARMLGIQVARARVLPAGIVVIRTLAEVLGSTVVEIAPSGIRTGLLLEFMEGDRSGSI